LLQSEGGYEYLSYTISKFSFEQLSLLYKTANKIKTTMIIQALEDKKSRLLEGDARQIGENYRN